METSRRADEQTQSSFFSIGRVHRPSSNLLVRKSDCSCYTACSRLGLGAPKPSPAFILMPHTGCGSEILDCFAITVAARSTLDLYANMQQVRSLNSMHIVYYPGAHYYYHRYYCGLDECGLTYIRQATHAATAQPAP
jgi:hypothetical protein